MAIKHIKPTSNARRNMSVLKTTEGSVENAPARLFTKRKNTAGRNAGKISIRHRGGRSKNQYRKVDFNGADKFGVPGVIEAIAYDPARTANVALIKYADGDRRFRLSHKGAKLGDSVMTDKKAKAVAGNRMEVQNVPLGFTIYNIELTEKKGGQAVRSAGAVAKLMSLEGEKAQILMPSGEIRLIAKTNLVTIGEVGNDEHSLIKVGKAGRTRLRGRRPQVRGKAMNPNDHPHGGGEGACPIGMSYPKTPWGSHALGVKTRNKSKSNRLVLRSRHRA